MILKALERLTPEQVALAQWMLQWKEKEDQYRQSFLDSHYSIDDDYYDYYGSYGRWNPYDYDDLEDIYDYHNEIIERDEILDGLIEDEQWYFQNLEDEDEELYDWYSFQEDFMDDRSYRKKSYSPY